MMEITIRTDNYGGNDSVYIDGLLALESKCPNLIKEQLELALKGYIKESDIDEYEIYKRWRKAETKTGDIMVSQGMLDKVGNVKCRLEYEELLRSYATGKLAPEPLSLTQPEIKALKTLIKERSCE